MSTTTETEPGAERAAARAEGKTLVLFALIKASSKYAYQGRYRAKQKTSSQAKDVRP